MYDFYYYYFLIVLNLLDRIKKNILKILGQRGFCFFPYLVLKKTLFVLWKIQTSSLERSGNNTVSDICNILQQW